MKSLVILIMVFCTVMGKSLCAEAHGLHFDKPVEFVQSDHVVSTAKVYTQDATVYELFATTSVVEVNAIQGVSLKTVNHLNSDLLALHQKPRVNSLESLNFTATEQLKNKLSASAFYKNRWITNCTIKQCLCSLKGFKQAGLRWVVSSTLCLV